MSTYDLVISKEVDCQRGVAGVFPDVYLFVLFVYGIKYCELYRKVVLREMLQGRKKHIRIL